MKIIILLCLLLPCIMAATSVASFKGNILRLWVGILWFFGSMITVVALWQNNVTLENVPITSIALWNIVSIVFILAALLILSERILNLLKKKRNYSYSKIEPIGTVPFHKLTNQHYVQDYVDIPDFIAAQRIRANRWSIYAFFLLAVITMALAFLVFAAADAAVYDYMIFSCVITWWCYFIAKLHFSKARRFTGCVFLAGKNHKLARVMWFIDAQPQTVQLRLYPLYAKLVDTADMAAQLDSPTQEHLEQMNEITDKIINASGVLEK